MKEITLNEAALAWAQGKRVEAGRINDIGMLPVDPIGESINEHWGPMVFGSKGYRFRLAPEPPAKKYRPWTPDEVLVGAEIRAIGLKWRGLILGVNANGQIEHFAGRTDLGYACENHEYSIDNGKTWLPCGVEI